MPSARARPRLIAIGRSVLEPAPREGLSVRATYQRAADDGRQHGEGQSGPGRRHHGGVNTRTRRATDSCSRCRSSRAAWRLRRAGVPELRRRGLRRLEISWLDPARQHGPVASGQYRIWRGVAARRPEVDGSTCGAAAGSPNRAAGLEIDVPFEGEVPAAIGRPGYRRPARAADRSAAPGRPAGRPRRRNPTAPSAGRPECWRPQVVRLSRLQLVMAQADSVHEAAEIPTPFSPAFSRATSTASASLSPPITGRRHSWPWRSPGFRCRNRHRRRSRSRRDRASPATQGSRASWHGAGPKAMPASIRSGIAPAGMPSARARDGPRTVRRRTAETSAGSRPPSRCRAAPPSASRRRSPPRPRVRRLRRRSRCATVRRARLRGW